MANDYDPQGYEPDPEEERPVSQQQAPTGRSSNHGRIAQMPDGSFEVWQEPVNGRGGRFVPLNTSSADARSRERFEELQTRRDTGRRVRDISQRFIDVNREQRSGGALDRIQLGLGMQAADFAIPLTDPETLPRLQRMRQLSQQVVGANWVPGTSGMANTAAEQENIRQRGVTPGNRGPVNMEAYLDVVEGVAEQEAAVRHMEQWLSTHTTLDGWDDAWAQLRDGVRSRARAEAIRRYNEGPNAAPAQQQSASQPPQRRTPTPAHVQLLLAGGGTDAQFDEAYGPGAAARARQQAQGRR